MLNRSTATSPACGGSLGPLFFPCASTRNRTPTPATPATGAGHPASPTPWSSSASAPMANLRSATPPSAASAGARATSTCCGTATQFESFAHKQVVTCLRLGRRPIPCEAVGKPHPMEPDPRPVRLLLDTDIGSNIDDALALAYLLRHPRCDLLGVTTVSGDVARR